MSQNTSDPRPRPIAYLTRRECFSAAHRLHNPDLTEAENVDNFAKCAHSNGHGHNYVVEVTVRGPVDQQTGMVMNLRDMKLLIGQAIMKPMDHKNLDKDVPYFAEHRGRVSTTENVTVFIWEQLKLNMANPELLYEVKVASTEKNIAVYRGELDS